MQPAPVIVTGAAGFAGRWVVRALLEAGRAVEAWTHRVALPSDLAGVVCRQVDITDPSACAASLRGRTIGGIIHLAAMTSVGACARRPSAARRVNVGGTTNVLSCLSAGTPAVLASTCHVYGRPEALPLREESPLRPRGIYATTKADSEQAARHVHPETVIARAFHHTGPGQTPQFALAQWARDLERSVSPVRTGDLSLRRDYSDVRDIARGYIHLLDHGPPGAIVNLCSGRAPSLEQLLQTMAGSGGVVTQPVREWFRVDDPPEMRGDPSTATRLGWRSTTPIAVTLQDLRASFRPG